MSSSVYAIYFNSKQTFIDILSAINDFQTEYENKIKKLCFAKLRSIDIVNNSKYIVLFTVYDNHQDCFSFFKYRNLDIFIFGLKLLEKLEDQSKWYIPFKNDNFTSFELENYTEFKQNFLSEDFIQ